MLSTFFIILSFTFIVFIIGFLLSFAAKKLKVEPKDPMQHMVEKCLPQVQCGQCGYIGCSEYALAILSGESPINLCPPGGDLTVKKLAELLHMPIPEDGPAKEELVASIIPYDCIGCTKCAKICPYDAIEGKLKEKHTVIPDYCTACGKCIDTCPKNCIIMQPIPQTTQTWDWKLPKE